METATKPRRLPRMKSAGSALAFVEFAVRLHLAALVICMLGLDVRPRRGSRRKRVRVRPVRVRFYTKGGESVRFKGLRTE